MSQSGLKRLIVALVLLFSVAGCEVAPDLGNQLVRQERPVINIPLASRQGNWIGSNGYGSCVHATMISLFRWQNRPKTADYWRRNYGGGEWFDDMAAKFDQAGVRYAYTTNGDVHFLEWACKTRRGCGIAVNGGAHMVALVHLDEKWAAVLDNNDVSKFRWVPRASLIVDWKASHGWAITPVYSPAAPLPR